MFPVLLDYNERKAHPEWPREVPWDFVAPHEQQAKDNHSQTLQRLAERGGLGLDEMLAVVTGRRWRDVEKDPAVFGPKLISLLADWWRNKASAPAESTP